MATSSTLVPQTPPIQVTQTSAVPAAVQPTLNVGRVLQVEVRQGPNQQTGISLAGQFVPATLPPGLQAGQQLSVQVVSNLDALVLKILADSDPAQRQQAIKSQIETQIKSLLADPKLLHTLLSNQGLQSPKESTSAPSPQLLKLQATLEKLLQSEGILQQKQLENPEQLAKSIPSLNQDKVIQSLTKQLGEAQRQLAQLSQHELNGAELRYLKTFGSEVEKFLSEHFPQLPDTPEQPTEGAKLPATNLPLNPKQFEARLKQLLTVLQEADNSILHKKALLENGTSSEEVRTFVTNLANELGKLIDRRASAQEVKDTLSKALQFLQKRFELSDAKSALAQTLQSSHALVSTLEQLTQAQEALKTLNPLLEASGQPVIQLFPLVSEGFLGHGAVAADPIPIGDEQSGKKNGAAKQSFTRLELTFSLPGLGPIAISLAHRRPEQGESELLLNIATQDQERQDFLKGSVGDLETRLRALGYEKTSINVGQSTTVPAVLEQLGRLALQGERVA